MAWFLLSFLRKGASWPQVPRSSNLSIHSLSQLMTRQEWSVSGAQGLLRLGTIELRQTRCLYHGVLRAWPVEAVRQLLPWCAAHAFSEIGSLRTSGHSQETTSLFSSPSNCSLDFLPLLSKRLLYCPCSTQSSPCYPSLYPSQCGSAPKWSTPNNGGFPYGMVVRYPN